MPRSRALGRPLLLALLVATAAPLGAGCKRVGDAPRPGVAPPAAAAVPAPALDLPTLAPPRPLPAARVVHLLYTTNVVGDAEPCG